MQCRLNKIYRINKKTFWNYDQIVKVDLLKWTTSVWFCMYGAVHSDKSYRCWPAVAPEPSCARRGSCWVCSVPLCVKCGLKWLQANLEWLSFVSIYRVLQTCVCLQLNHCVLSIYFSPCVHFSCPSISGLFHRWLNLNCCTDLVCLLNASLVLVTVV